MPDPRSIIVVQPLDAGQTAASGRDPGGPPNEEAAPFEIALDNDTVCVRSAGRTLTGARDVYCWGSWPSAGRTPRKEPLPAKMRVVD